MKPTIRSLADDCRRALYHLSCFFLYFLVSSKATICQHFWCEKSKPIKEFCLRCLNRFSSILDCIWVLECEIEKKFAFNVQVQVLLLDAGSMAQCHSSMKSLHVARAINNNGFSIDQVLLPMSVGFRYDFDNSCQAQSN